MEKGRGKNEYFQGATARRQSDRSNNKEESCNNSYQNGTDSTHANLSRYHSMVSLSSGTLDILDLGPKSRVRGKTRAGQSGLRARKKLSRKLIAGRNESSPRKQRQGSCEQYRLHPKHLRVSKRKPRSFRGPNRCRTTPDSLESCSMTVHLSGRASQFPRQRKPAAQIQCISTSPNIILANSKIVPTSPKPSRCQLTSSRPSKSKIPRRVNSNTAKTYMIPKSNEKYTKENTNILPIFDRMSVRSWDLNKRHTSLQSRPGKKSPQLANTPPSLSPFRNMSFNSSKTSKCTGRASTASQASKAKSRVGSVRSKRPLNQRPQFHNRTKKASKSTYQFGKKNRGSKMTAARRRKLISPDINQTRLSLSLPDNLKSLSPEPREKATKLHNVPGDNIINSKATTKPVSSAKRKRSKNTSYNKGLWQNKAPSKSARSKSTASHEKESAKEKPSSLTVSPKKKLTRTSPKTSLAKFNPSRINKARLLRGTRTRPGKNTTSNTSRREQTALGVVPRPRVSLATYSRSGVGFNSLGVYKSHNVQRRPENVQETSFLFKFQSKRWLLKPSTESAAQSGGQEGASKTERRDCFAAWKMTKHEVLQSCSSDDLLIMNNSVKQSPPHGPSASSSCGKSMKTEIPQPDTFLDHQKQVISLDHQEPDISLDHQKPVNSLDQKPVNSLDHQKPNITLENQKAASIRQEARLYFISGTRPLLSLKVQPIPSLSNLDTKSHSEYTSSTDTCSGTSKWSLGSSICSNASPSKRQDSSTGSTAWPVKSWSCIYCLTNERKRKKRRGCLISSKTELQNKKEDCFKYGQISRPPAVKAKPNRLTHQREHFRLLKTSLEFSNSKKVTNKHGKRYLSVNPEESPPKFVKRSSHNHGLQPELSPSAIQKSKKPKSSKLENKPLPVKLERFGSRTTTVESEDVTIEQLSLVPYNSSESQKQTLHPSWSPAVKPKQDTSCIISRVVRRESLKRLSEAKKWGLITQPTRESKPRVWKWRILTVAFVLLLATCYYFGFSDI